MSSSYQSHPLTATARRIRREVVRMLGTAQSGHLGGSLSVVEILTALYFNWLRIDPANPLWSDRDRLVLSKGHAAPALYATLAVRGYFPVAELATLRQYDSRLQGHPERGALPGIDFGGGSLGQGLSAAVGMALGLRLQGSQARSAAIVGDGELDEGQIWEAVQAGAHWNLGRLIAIVDWNGLQQSGATSQVLDLGDLPDRWRAAGWLVEVVDGHNVASLLAALPNETDAYSQPRVILARTHKGQGVSFACDNPAFHSRPLTREELEMALREVE